MLLHGLISKDHLLMIILIEIFKSIRNIPYCRLYKKIINRTIASLLISSVNQILVHSNNTEYHIFFSNTHQFRCTANSSFNYWRCLSLFPWTAPDLTVGFISFQLHQGDIRISGCYQPVAGKMVFNILEARNIPRVSILGAVSTYDQHTAWTKWIMKKYLNHQHAS